MSKWIAAAQAITRKSSGGGSAESARSQDNTPKTGANGLYTLYAPPTHLISRVGTTASNAPVDASQDEQRTLKPAEIAELVTLVNRVAAYEAFTQTQRAEAHQIAQTGGVAALKCFRDLAAKLPTDNRIKCSQCQNLTGDGCTRWRELKAVRGWRPVPLPLRCEQFKPKAGQDDQRTAAERWPDLSITTH